jgi:hypothetical protein
MLGIVAMERALVNESGGDAPTDLDRCGNHSKEDGKFESEWRACESVKKLS